MAGQPHPSLVLVGIVKMGNRLDETQTDRCNILESLERKIAKGRKELEENPQKEASCIIFFLEFCLFITFLLSLLCFWFMFRIFMVPKYCICPYYSNRKNSLDTTLRFLLQKKERELIEVRKQGRSAGELLRRFDTENSPVEIQNTTSNFPSTPASSHPPSNQNTTTNQQTSVRARR